MSELELGLGRLVWCGEGCGANPESYGISRKDGALYGDSAALPDKQLGRLVGKAAANSLEKKAAPIF